MRQGLDCRELSALHSSRRKLRPRDHTGMGGNKPKVQLGLSRQRRRRTGRGRPDIRLLRRSGMIERIYFEEVRTTTTPLATGRSPWQGSFRIWPIQREAEAPPSKFMPSVQASFFIM